MTMSSSVEEQYIKELTQGSYKAFDALYSMYSHRLYSFAFKLTKSHLDASEIVQNSFINLWLNRDKILTCSSLQPYLFTIAKNQFINKLRHNINLPLFVDYVNYLNEKKISENNVIEKLNYDDFKAQLKKAKKSLSKNQRKIFELSKELGYTNKEIAQRLNLSEQTVKNQLSISLKILKEKLFKYSFLFYVFFL